MKVLYINTSDSSGGAAIACLRLQSAMDKFTPVVSNVLVQEKKTHKETITTTANTPLQKKLVWLRFIAERLAFLPYEKDKSIRFLFNRAIWGIDISKHPLVQEADILHLHWINFGFLSIDDIEKLMTLDKPVVWTFHDMWAFTGGCHHSGNCDHYLKECGNCKFLTNPKPHDISHTSWMSKKKAYSNHSFVSVGCSNWLANRARKSSLLSGTNIQAIPNPLNISLFKPFPKKEARITLGLPADKEFILFAAMRVNAIGKGFQYLVEALKNLVEGNPEITNQVELLVFGQSSPEVLADLPLKVHSLGHLTDADKIVAAYNAASMFVTPSLEENLPNTIMEAFACGTPSVGFEVGGIPEMIDHQKNGFLSKYRSIESLAEGIKWVLANNKEGQLSEKAREKAVNYYSEEVVAQQYYRLYQSLL